jgi:hypothetical protein
MDTGSDGGAATAWVAALPITVAMPAAITAARRTVLRQLLVVKGSSFPQWMQGWGSSARGAPGPREA